MENNYLDAKCTIYKNVYEFKSPYSIKVETALNRIQDGTSKDMIDRLRNETDNQKQDSIKKMLPCVVFSGVFGARRDDAIKFSTSLLILDFDKLDDPDAKKEELSKNEYIFAAWISPRGKGVKALVKIADYKRYQEHFDALKDMFPDMDYSGRNISRACFESYDPDIYVNRESKVFKEVVERVIEYKNSEVSEIDVYSKLKMWLNNKSETFTSGNRNNYIYKLASACCRYGLSDSTTLDLILRDFATSDFNQKEITLAVRSSYRSNNSGVASFENGSFVDKSTRKEVEVNDLSDGFEDFSHVIFASDVINQATKIYNEGYEELKGINAPILDYHFKLKRKEVTLMTGYGNMGKSTKMLWILLNRAVLYGEKFAVYSPESVPAEEFYIELVEMLAGCDCSARNPNRPPLEVFNFYYDFIGEHFFFVYPEKVMPTKDAIKQTFLELVIKTGVDGVIIDPFNQMYHDRKKITREDFYLEEVLSDFTKFAQQNNVYFIIVAHPTSSIVIEDGEYRRPTMFNISGGAMWSNKMHNILIYHRPFARSDKSNPAYEFTSEKIKKQKIVGKVGSFIGEYYLNKRRFMLPSLNPITKEVDFDNTFDPLGNNIKISKKFNEVIKKPKDFEPFN